MQINELASNPNQQTFDPQPTNTPIPQQQPSDVSLPALESMQGNKFNKWLIIGPVVFALVILGIAGVFVYQNCQLKKQVPKTQPKPTPKAVGPTITVNSTADWKTYKNEKYRFEFRHPGDWGLTIKEDSKSIDIALVKDDFTQEKLDTGGESSRTPRYQIGVFAQDNPNDLSAKEYLSTLFNEDQLESLETREVAGALWVGDKTGVAASRGSKIYLLTYNAITHLETHNKFLNVFDQILSTFESTN